MWEIFSFILFSFLFGQEISAFILWLSIWTPLFRSAFSHICYSSAPTDQAVNSDSLWEQTFFLSSCSQTILLWVINHFLSMPSLFSLSCCTHTYSIVAATDDEGKQQCCGQQEKYFFLPTKSGPTMFGRHYKMTTVIDLYRKTHKGRYVSKYKSREK